MDFNTNNKIAQLKDIDGNTMSFTYSGDNLTQVKDAYNRTFTFTYTNNLISSVSDSTGRSISYGYDATTGDLTTYTDPESKVWGYGYNDPNHPHCMTSMSNPLSVTMVTNTYDSLGRAKEQTFPRQGGGTATHKFYFSGYRNVEEDPDGKTIVYYFDDKGRLIAEKNQLITDETQYSSKKEYDGQNHVVKVTDARGYITTFEYDGNHNLTKTTNALLKEINMKYDSQFPFRLTDTIDPLLNGSHIEYDTEHHPTLSRACSFSGTTCNSIIAGDGNEVKTSATFYPNGLTETMTDARLTTTTLTYDTYGNLYTTKVGSHPIVKTAYDANTNYQKRGWLTSLTDQVNTTTNFPLYNNRGQLKKKTDPLLKDTIFEYDDAGRLSYVIDRKNQRIDYSYTPTSKIDTISYPDYSTVHFIYNQHDDLTRMQDSLGTTNYTYNADHSLNTVTDPNGFVVTYNKYDAAGNLTELIYPGGKKVIYSYDELNRLKTVTIDWLASKPVATYYYDYAGRLDYLVNFNGSITDYGYDNANRLTSLENKKSETYNNSIIASYGFTLDGNGNRTQVVQNEPLTLTLTTNTVSYGYNAKKNRLMTANTTNFSYDDEGQLNNNSYGSYYDSYEFDGAHRLRTIWINGGIDNYINYYYDGRGNRLSADRDGWSYFTSYVYDAGGNLLMEVDTIRGTSYFIHGLGLMAMVTDTGNVYTYHFNAVGSTIAMSDSSQNVVNKYSYDPFGKILNQVEAVAQPFKFVGQHGVMFEPDLNLYYMRARYYDPEVGRFISEDPIGFEGGINLYAYASNNPVLLNDPRGLWSLSFDLYEIVGGGVTIGGGKDQPFFISTRAGFGVGGGGSYDPEGGSPSANPNSISDIGFAAYAGVGFLPFELGAGSNAGISHLPGGEVSIYASDVDMRPILSTGKLEFKGSVYFSAESTLYPKNIINNLLGIGSKCKFY